MKQKNRFILLLLFAATLALPSEGLTAEEGSDFFGIKKFTPKDGSSGSPKKKIKDPAAAAPLRSSGSAEGDSELTEEELKQLREMAEQAEKSGGGTTASMPSKEAVKLPPSTVGAVAPKTPLAPPKIPALPPKNPNDHFIRIPQAPRRAPQNPNGLPPQAPPAAPGTEKKP